MIITPTGVEYDDDDIAAARSGPDRSGGPPGGYAPNARQLDAGKFAQCVHGGGPHRKRCRNAATMTLFAPRSKAALALCDRHFREVSEDVRANETRAVKKINITKEN